MNSTYELSACSGKRSFPNVATAEMARRRAYRDVRLEPYRCRSCGKIHLGTSLKVDIKGGAFNRSRYLQDIRAKEAMSDVWRHA